jgi:hypothetical protein
MDASSHKAFFAPIAVSGEGVVPFLNSKPTLEVVRQRDPPEIPHRQREQTRTAGSAVLKVESYDSIGVRYSFMPRSLDEEIRRLCERAIHAENPDDAERLTRELRSAMQEYMRLANQSLVDRSRTISHLDSKHDLGLAEKTDNDPKAMPLATFRH